LRVKSSRQWPMRREAPARSRNGSAARNPGRHTKAITMNSRKPNRAWIYKVRDDAAEHAVATGDWYGFFEAGKPDRWGGPWATRNAESLRNFQDLRVGDRIWAYQTVSAHGAGWSRCLVGLARVASFRPSTEVPGDSDVVLEPAFELQPPVAVHRHKRDDPVLAQASALKPGHAGTLFALERAEDRALAELCQRLGGLPAAEAS
jgi:hypothetical protein